MEGREWCGRVEGWKAIGEGTLIFQNSCPNSALSLVMRPPNTLGVAFGQLILFSELLS
jgi:hypothetical protein